MSRNNDSSAGSTNTFYIVAVAAAVVVSAVLAPVAYDYAQSAQSEGTVSVITVSGVITGSKVDTLSEDLREARINDSIKSVVLKVDSGGGAVAPSERLYLEVLRTAKEIPVVASVQGVSASGAYYGILPANETFMLSSGQVGSVGVIGAGGTAPVPDRIIRTGPDKAQPTTEQRRQQVESLKRQFVNRVVEHRGENITLSREEIANAKTYLGPRAAENGLIDQLGTLSVAIDHAAEMAGMEDYDIARKEPPRGGLIFFATTVDGQKMIYKQQTSNDAMAIPVTQPLAINELPYHDPGMGVDANASA
ncbi:S49 family peptidase [Haloquadratum walsbyi]|jgi:protease-4|uniref:Signal peptide peptidase SppA n=1 Tax=Haloquadratum walsbyi (strain DSM 16790 / HBSQ001) TaxID=362976 RepID=Q18FR4_HALWD|nr:S49 family peptidase [Haloquadratum walsbyi]CAJ53191.1 signal peptide peptidase SppA [Haloquadratum walsbyi DSM 16790]